MAGPSEVDSPACNIYPPALLLGENDGSIVRIELVDMFSTFSIISTCSNLIL